MRVVALLLACGLFVGQAYAQKDVARTTAYLELGGNALLVSLNVDHLVTEHVSVRVGGMVLPNLRSAGDGCDAANPSPCTRPEQATDSGLSLASFVAMGNLLIGTGRHRLELGAGALLFWSQRDADGMADGRQGLAATGTVGYRFQPFAGQRGVRFTFTPLANREGVHPWFGLSFTQGF